MVSNETARQKEVLRKVQDVSEESMLRDVIFRVTDFKSGEQVEMGASSAHLIAVSDYFEALFTGDAVSRGMRPIKYGVILLIPQQ